MSKYYFLSCSLPSLSFEKPPEITFESFKLLLSLNLNKKDSEKIIRMRQLIDLQNLRCMWSNKPVDSRGNLSIKEIEEALLVYDFFPSYVFDFIEKYKDNESRLRLFPYLISKFFK
jgi:hypothetical protein